MNLIEKLIRIDKEKFTEKETKQVKSARLSKILGVDTEITIRELNGRKINEIMSIVVDKNGNRNFSKNYDMNLMYCVEGIIEPNLRDAALMEHFGAKTPKDLAAYLFDNEVNSLADEIFSLSGMTEKSEEDVKNS